MDELILSTSIQKRNLPPSQRIIILREGFPGLPADDPFSQQREEGEKVLLKTATGLPTPHPPSVTGSAKIAVVSHETSDGEYFKFRKEDSENIRQKSYHKHISNYP